LGGKTASIADASSPLTEKATVNPRMNECELRILDSLTRRVASFSCHNLLGGPFHVDKLTVDRAV
jgi:hypothetical protein